MRKENEYCFKLLSLAVLCYTAVENRNKCQSNGPQASLVFLSTQLLNERVFPNPISQSPDDSSMNSALGIFFIIREKENPAVKGQKKNS